MPRSPAAARDDGNSRGCSWRLWGRGGRRRDQLGPFVFEDADPLLQIARLVEPERGHGEVVPPTELQQLALDQREPCALGFQFRAHRPASRLKECGAV
jgi:hypothetical protein